MVSESTSSKGGLGGSSSLPQALPDRQVTPRTTTRIPETRPLSRGLACACVIVGLGLACAYTIGDVGPSQSHPVRPIR